MKKVSQIGEDENLEYLSKKDVQRVVEVKIKEVEAKNLELEAKIRILEELTELDQKNFIGEILCLQQSYDHEKAKASEQKIVEFREELLKVKN